MSMKVRLFAVGLTLVAMLAARTAAAQNLYGATDSGDSVVIFDTVTGAVLDDVVSPGSGGLELAEGVALGPDGDLYVASASGDAILHFDGTTGNFLGDFTSGPPLVSPMGITFGPDGNLYVASRLTNEVLMYDGLTGEFIIDFVAFKDGGLLTPEAVLFGPDGDLYVASANTNEVLRYSGDDGSFLGVFASGGGLDYPHGLAFSPTNGNLFVSSHFSNAVLEFDPTGASVGDAIAPGAAGLSGPVGLAFAPDGSLFVASFNTSSVLVRAPDGSVSVLAASLSTPVSFLAFIDRPSLLSVALSATNVPGGCSTITGTVTLTRAATAGGIQISLSTTNAAAALPATVVVPEGAVSVTFPVSSSQVLTSTTGQVRADFAGVTRSTTLTLRAVRLSAHSITPTTIPGGANAAGSVSLECIAPQPGVTITLSSSNTSVAQVPATVLVPAGQTSLGYLVSTISPASTTPAVVTASGGGTSLARSITVTTSANQTLLSVAVSPSSVVGGRSAVGTVTIGAPAGPGGIVIGLALSPGTAASLPSSSVTVAEGQATAQFAISTSAVGSTVTEIVTATLGAQTRTRAFSVLPNTPKLLQLQPKTVVGGNSTIAKVTLQEVAGAGGVTVTVSSSNPAAASPLVGSFVITAGNLVGSTTITTSGVVSSTAVTITVSANGVSRSATLTVNP